MKIHIGHIRSIAVSLGLVGISAAWLGGCTSPQTQTASSPGTTGGSVRSTNLGAIGGESEILAAPSHSTTTDPWRTDWAANLHGKSQQNQRLDLQAAARDTVLFSTENHGDEMADRGAVVGVFGELVNQKAAAAEPSDGADNLFRITHVTEGAVFDPEVDRSGKTLVFASTMHSRTSDIYRQSIGGTTVTRLTDDPAQDVMPSYSPDGSNIAFASNRAGDWNIYWMPAEGGRPVQLTRDADPELHPTWSPDGRTIAYCKFNAQSARWEIWTVSLDNPGVSNFLVYGLFPRWNPDPARSKLLFQRGRERGSRFHSVWTVDHIAGEARNETEIVSAANAATINPSWSPDGARIVFVTVVDPDNARRDRPDESDVWMVNLDGSQRTSLTNGEFANFQPVWSRDGNIYFISDRSGIDNIWAVAATSAVNTHSTNKGMGIAGVSGDDASN